MRTDRYYYGVVCVYNTIISYKDDFVYIVLPAVYSAARFLNILHLRSCAGFY